MQDTVREVPARAGTFEGAGFPVAWKVVGDGPPVVFAQGTGLHGDGWLPQVEALSERFSCLTFDNPGLGGSVPAPSGLLVPEIAEAVLRLMTHLGWDRAHLVGHSLGALVAVEAAAQAPARAMSLSLLCAVPRGRDATRVTWPIIRLGVAAKLGGKRATRRAFLRLTMPAARLAGADLDALAADLVPYFGHDLADQPEAVSDQLAALRAYDARDRLTAVRSVPALVVSASEDPIAPPRFGVVLARSLDDARYVVVPGAAHGVTISHAEEINRLLAERFATATS